MIAEPTAVATVVSVATAGFAANFANRRRVRAFANAQVAAAVEATRNELRASVTTPRAIDLVWADAVRASCTMLSRVECHVEPKASSTLPVVARHRSLPDAVDADHQFVLPSTGAIIEFVDPRSSHHVVLRPAAGAGAVELDRRFVTAFVDQLGLALGRMDR